MAYPEQPTASPTSLLEAVSRLTAEEWLLVELRDELYDGQWEEMRIDLESRLRGEPYIFKLVNRIQDDLERMNRLRELEMAWQIDLRQYRPV